MLKNERIGLVIRLREMAAAVGRHHSDDRDTWGKAADEIERLSAIIVCERIEHAKAQRDTERWQKEGLEIVEIVTETLMHDDFQPVYAQRNFMCGPALRGNLERILDALGRAAIDAAPFDDRAEESQAEAAAAVQEERGERGDGD